VYRNGINITMTKLIKNKFDKLKWQREHRKLIKNRDTLRYEKTPNGFLMRLYRNMKSRVTGIQHKKAHLYKGLCILPKEEFYNWAKASTEFSALFDLWKKSKYARRLTPTVDRIDSTKGYELSNMQWLTHSENSRGGSIARNKARSHS
jgi:hypothetical protein